MERFWDKNNNYAAGIIHESTFWTLEVSYRQHTIGSVIIFCKRPVEKITDLTSDELLDLQNIMKKYQDALDKIWQPDRYNYLQLGNALHNLHFHVIPRYKNDRTYANLNWHDPTFGTVPTWSKKEFDEELIIKIREEIKKVL